jgi:hypothetical protein
MCDRPDMDDLSHREWKCINCGALNSEYDAECQFCPAPTICPDEDDEETE